MGARHGYDGKDFPIGWNCIDCMSYFTPEERANNRIRYCEHTGIRRLINCNINVRKDHPKWCPLETDK